MLKNFLINGIVVNDSDFGRQGERFIDIDEEMLKWEKLQ